MSEACQKWGCTGLGTLTGDTLPDESDQDVHFFAHWITHHLALLPGDAAVESAVVNSLSSETLAMVCSDLRNRIAEVDAQKLRVLISPEPAGYNNDGGRPPDLRFDMLDLASPTSSQPVLSSPLLNQLKLNEPRMPRTRSLEFDHDDSSEASPRQLTFPTGEEGPRPLRRFVSSIEVRNVGSVGSTASAGSDNGDGLRRHSSAVLYPALRRPSVMRRAEMEVGVKPIEKRHIDGLSTLNAEGHARWTALAGECEKEILRSMSRSVNAKDAVVTVESIVDKKVLCTLRAERGRLEIMTCDVITLVYKLANEDHPDTRFIDTFLLTYRAFLSPHELLEYLIARFDITLPPSPTVRQVHYHNKHREAIQLRCVSVVKKWIDQYFFDLNHENMLGGLELFLSLLEGHESPAFHKLVQQLRVLVDEKVAEEEERERVREAGKYPPPPRMAGYHEERSVANMDVSVAAATLTIIDSELFLAIQPHEFVRQMKARPADLDVVAPNLSAFIARFNTVSSWAATEICVVPVLKKRAELLKKFIDICIRLSELQNYNSTMAIISGLNMSSVTRLKKTWDLVPSKSRSALRKLEKLMSSNENYKEYRKQLAAVTPPAIPFIGLPLKDLTFFNENPTFQGDLVNFEKMRRIAQTVFAVNRFQLTKYSLPPDPTALALLSDVMTMSDVELRGLSLSCEPAAKKGLFGRKEKTEGAAQ